MSAQAVVDSIGSSWVVVMAVCFVAVIWWAFKKRGKGGGA